MELTEFITLTSPAVHEILQQTPGHEPGVAIPFNGTRRWYMATYQKTAEEVYTQDYLDRVFHRMREVMEMMFADGVHTIYTPIVGRDLASRGENYVKFADYATGNVAQEEAMVWYLKHHVHASVYGQTDLLSSGVQKIVQNMAEKTHTPQVLHYLRYGVFADKPVDDLIHRTIALYQKTGEIPTEQALLQDYYGGPAIPVDIWIGSDQPTVYDIPMVLHGNTALYFLQFPTLYLTREGWRRILYDYLFVRGDQETLYPDNITQQQTITGLGVRTDGGWMPATS